MPTCPQRDRHAGQGTRLSAVCAPPGGKKDQICPGKIEQQRIAAAERSQRQRTAISRQSAEELRKTGSKTHHRVRKGESLSVIAGKCGVSIGAIKLWNGLKGI
ncbi:MAG: LysM peptidoglycan-binding domain-containing protein [Calditrichae bacterium]|nr:LysM peptidoglycan-binding domain-containing protein [Calditrichia bacterium]